jgi:hypothetical protein
MTTKKNIKWVRAEEPKTYGSGNEFKIRCSYYARKYAPASAHDFYGYISLEEAEDDVPNVLYMIDTDKKFKDHWIKIKLWDRLNVLLRL